MPLSYSTPSARFPALHDLEGWPVESVSAAVVEASVPDGSSATGSGSPSPRVTTWGDTSQVYSLASVSKLLTAYAVLIAVEEGAFELDDPVPSSVAADWKSPPTVRELLAHASGVGFRERSPEKPAQTRRIYSSAGYDMLADTIADTTGISFEDYASEALNMPLGMSIDFSGSAGHGFRASVDDMSTFAAEVLQPRLLSPSTLREAFTVQYPDLDGVVPGYGMQKPCPWGLGFEVHGEKTPHWLGASMPEDVCGHFGQSGTFLWVHPDSGAAAVVLTDEDFGDWAKERWDSFNDSLWEQLH
ncbi:serine hydrolase [Corynebacterium sp. zg254]|uniref:Beta-lactamase family protein n=1 Tax=Corynebacterium zhongnanshanii TaxID=2768834 RepID=A0ABQ6VD87_9CORY|nr:MULTISPECIES: serine hydrolase domain-containing protein [Corynebacterium]KAB3520882.1 beta-lactamase family protein [Corynebacterium zhongnanshanii]MCR5914510.1 serine hydrolase [Corynebacterium sp. zg254]